MPVVKCAFIFIAGKLGIFRKACQVELIKTIGPGNNPRQLLKYLVVVRAGVHPGNPGASGELI